MILRLLQRLALFLALGLMAGASARAAEATVAVAANFAAAMDRLAPAFEQASGHRLTLVLGSSGKLAAQVQQGAPFDVFLSADVERPAALQAAGFAVPDSRFTYALGRLVLWSADPQAFSDGPAYLAAGRTAQRTADNECPRTRHPNRSDPERRWCRIHSSAGG